MKSKHPALLALREAALAIDHAQQTSIRSGQWSARDQETICHALVLQNCILRDLITTLAPTLQVELELDNSARPEQPPSSDQN